MSRKQPAAALDTDRPSAAQKAREVHLQVDYASLARFRYELRKFLAFSEMEAMAAGVTPQHYQALVVIKGFSSDGALSVGEIAERLCIRHHTAVELINRMAGLGLVRRVQDLGDRRRVLVALTEAGEDCLRALAVIHVRELRRIGPMLMQTLRRLQAPQRASSNRTDQARRADGSGKPFP